MKLLFCAFLLSYCCAGFAQVKIGDNPETISPGSLLELESTSRALALPRMTTVQMEGILSPLKGMIVFNIDSNCIYLYKNENTWASLTTENTGQQWPYHSNDSASGTNGNGQGIISLTGVNLIASGANSHAEGVNSQATGAFSLAFGNADTASGSGSVALGYENKVAGNYSIAVGLKNITNYQSAFAMGQENADSGWASMAMGLKNRINNGVSYSNAFGYINTIRGGFSHNLLGESNIINSGRSNSAIGSGNLLQGNFNSAVGAANNVLAGNSNFTAGENNLVKAGSGSSILGQDNISDGNYLGTIGKSNIVFYQSAVALGQENRDSGWASIAGGLANLIEKDVQYSAAFGKNNIAGKNFSLPLTNAGAGTFSGGVGNLNTGYASVALGGSNRSTNYYSLAANFNNISNSFGMSAFGHYNDTLPAIQGSSMEATEMLFTIGNGVNEQNRRNSFTMLRNGFTAINTNTETGAHPPRAELDVKGTGALIVPTGTSAERPVTPVAGMIRFCTDCAGGPVLQGFDGNGWVNL